jgi:hypothetical protein
VRGEARSFNIDDVTGRYILSRATREAVIVAAQCLAPHPEPPLRYGPDLSPQKSGERLRATKNRFVKLMETATGPPESRMF